MKPNTKNNIFSRKVYWRNYFKEISEKYTEKYKTGFYYNRISYLLRKRIFSQYFSDVRHKRILELACGQGSLPERIINNNEVIGVDYILKFLTNNRCEKLVCADIEYPLPFRNGIFDIITLIGAFYYLDNWEKVLQNISAILKNNGTVITEIPNEDCIYYKIFRKKDFEKFTSLSYVTSLNTEGLYINNIKGCAFPLTKMIETKKINILKKISPFFVIEWTKK